MKGHVHKRGKTWTYTFDAPEDPLTGERRQVTKGGWSTDKEAWRECRAAMKRVEEGRHVKPSKQTVAEYLVGTWLPAVKTANKATTWGNWKVYAETYVIPLLGNVKFQQLKTEQIQELYAHLLVAGRVKAERSVAMYEVWKEGTENGKDFAPRDIARRTGASIHAARSAVRRFKSGWEPNHRGAGLAPKTVRNVHTMLHKALGDAVAAKYILDNVAAAAKAPSVSRRRPTVWTPTQIRRFLQFVREDRFYAMYLLAAMTGFRRAELCGLRWSAIDLDAGTVSVEPDTRVVVNGQVTTSDGKGPNSNRLLSLDRRSIAALRVWQVQQKAERAFFEEAYKTSTLAFTWEDGRPIHPDVVRQRFQRFSDRLGLPRIRLHDLRHSYATTSLKAGANPKIISHRLGHASVAFTLSVYAHALPGADQDAADEIATLILGEEEQDKEEEKEPPSEPPGAAR